MSIFWSSWITILSLGCWLLITGVLVYMVRSKTDLEDDGTTGHSYDGIKEYDKPLPKWWLGIFYGTIVWALGYWVFFPALMPHAFNGIATVEVDGKTVPWSSKNELYSDLEDNNAVFTANFQNEYLPNPKANDALTVLATLQHDMKSSAEPSSEMKSSVNEQIQQLAPYVKELSTNTRALMAGESLFLQNCAVCHGSNAKGATGYPNLTDNDWLHGGEPENILLTLHNGRVGGMPEFRDTIGENGVKAAAEYVLALSGNQNDYELDEVKVAQGKAIFNEQCVICHGENAKGMIETGSANLTDNIWLFGGDRETIRETIRNGRAGVMPEWQTKLGNERIMLLAAYVYSLSNSNLQASSTSNDNVVATAAE